MEKFSGEKFESPEPEENVVGVGSQTEQEKDEKTVEKLPRFKFFKGALLTEGEKVGLGIMIGSMRLGIEKDKEMDEELSGQIWDAAFYDQVWCRTKLGLDVSERAPDFTKIILVEKDTYAKIKGEDYVPGDVGCHIPIPGGVILVDDGKTEQMVPRFNHEAIHSFSSQTIDVKKTVLEDKKEVRQEFRLKGVHLYGFEGFKKEVFQGLNEWTTEAINLEALNLQRERGRDHLSSYEVVYISGVLFLDALIEETASRLQKKPEEISRELYTAYFKGDIGALRMFEQAFGKGTLSLLSEMKGIEPGGHLFYTAVRKFGFEKNFYEKAKRYFTGKPVAVFRGVEIQNQFLKEELIRNNVVGKRR